MKRGQAAMEFLMTYGWAILVVIAAIAALAYFGVLDPANLLPERCQFPAGMDCIDKAAIQSGTPGTVTFALRNNAGFAINISGVDITGDCTLPSAVQGIEGTSGDLATAGTDLLVDELEIGNNEVFRVQITCTEDLTSGDKFEGDVTVSYTNSNSGIDQVAAGNIRGKVA